MKRHFLLMTAFCIATICLLVACFMIDYETAHIIPCYNCGVGYAILEQHDGICWDCIVPQEGIIKMTAQTIEKTTAVKVWENLQYCVLIMSIAGQVLTNIPTWGILIAQSVWLIANVIATVRDFKLKRPTADKVKNGCLTGVTIGLVVLAICNLF